MISSGTRRLHGKAEAKVAVAATLVREAVAGAVHGRRRRERHRMFRGRARALVSARTRALGRMRTGPSGRLSVGKAKAAETVGTAEGHSIYMF